MSKINLKKLLILNIPYILVGLFATNFGEAWRLAEGADSSAKILGFFNAMPIALSNPLPSFHPMDLLIGIACGAGLRLAVYTQSSNTFLLPVREHQPHQRYAETYRIEKQNDFLL